MVNFWSVQILGFEVFYCSKFLNRMTASKLINNYILSSELTTVETDSLTGLVLTSNQFDSLIGDAITGEFSCSNVTQSNQNDEESSISTFTNSQRDFLNDYATDSSSGLIFDNFVSTSDTFGQSENLMSQGNGINIYFNPPLNQPDSHIKVAGFVTRDAEPMIIPRDSSQPAPGYNFPELAPWLDNDPNTPSDVPSTLSANIVKSNRALILDPFQNQFESSDDKGDEANNIEETLKAAGFIVTRKAKTDVTIEDFKNLDQYGVIAIVSHGARVDLSTEKPTAIYDDPNILNPDRSIGEVVVVTGVLASSLPDNDNDNPYRDDLVAKNLVKVNLNGTIYLALTPSFITKYTQSLPNSLIYVGACDSTYNDTLAQAFISKGAGAFVGYSRIVDSFFADPHGQAMFNALVADRTTSEIPGINVDRDSLSGGALFELSSGSAGDITIDIGLRNGKFEIDNLSGWATQGDARAVTQLGPLSAPQGQEMAFISTGSSASSISQRFFVPTNAQNLTFSYDVVSEEPMEYVGTEFDDQFDVLLNPVPTSSNPSPNQTTVAIETINTSTWLPISGIDFPDGDDTTFHTGFKEVSFDLTSLRGQQVDLIFRVFDRGDAAFDTAAVFDNIQITTI